MVIGSVKEYHFTHQILVPPGVAGTVKKIRKGRFKVTDVVCELDSGVGLTMLQRWPVRKGRPYARKLDPSIPLITGQRIFDCLFRSPRAELP